MAAQFAPNVEQQGFDAALRRSGLTIRHAPHGGIQRSVVDDLTGAPEDPEDDRPFVGRELDVVAVYRDGLAGRVERNQFITLDPTWPKRNVPAIEVPDPF